MRPVDGLSFFSTAASGTSFTSTHIFILSLLLVLCWGGCYSLAPLTDESISRGRGGLADEIDDRLRRSPGREDLRHAESLELGDVIGRDRPADRHDDIVDPLRAEQLDDARDERHVRAREDREANGVGVLLDHRLHDLLGRLVKARVDHLHTRVAQGARDDLGAAVVAVEAGLGNHHANLAGSATGHPRADYARRCARAATWPLPTVQAPTQAAAASAATTFRRRGRRSRCSTSQPSRSAIWRRSRSGLTTTGWPTARSIGRSDSESE